MEHLREVIIKALIEEYGKNGIDICDDCIYIEDEDVDLGLRVKIEVTT